MTEIYLAISIPDWLFWGVLSLWTISLVVSIYHLWLKLKISRFKGLQ